MRTPFGLRTTGARRITRDEMMIEGTFVACPLGSVAAGWR
jgi:hypothetical protein